jgi:hypothetical protein
MFSASRSTAARSFTAFLFVVGVMLVMIPSSAADLGRCYSADVPASIILPDGSSHAPGSLRICLTSKESPVRGRHGSSVDGRAIGAYQSELGKSEAGALPGAAYFVFQRNERSDLVLLGYAAYLGNEWHTYRLAYGSASPVAFERQSVEVLKDVVLLAAARR